MALKFHPDRNRGSEKEIEQATHKFKDITEAYGVLSDPEKKLKYDRGELDEVVTDTNNFDFQDLFGNQADIYKMFFNQNGNGHHGQQNGNTFFFKFA